MAQLHVGIHDARTIRDVSLGRSISFRMPASRFQKHWQTAVAYLASQCHEGSWPYKRGQGPSVESTSWCAVAMRGDPAVSRSATRHLLARQNHDGGWSNVAGADPSEASDWSTGLALLALRLGRANVDDTDLRPGVDNAFSQGLAFLMSNRTELYNKPFGEMLVYIVKGPGALDYARGWPWTPGCFHWVEPTSYALMAIKPSSQARQPDWRNTASRAQGFLLDHACEKGGWNHGNNVCLSAKLPPFTVTTAEALLALQDLGSHPAVKKGLAHLQSVAPAQQSVMALSWCALAFDALGQDAGQLLDKLVGIQRDDGSFSDNIFLSALATCALACATAGNPLKFNQKI